MIQAMASVGIRQEREIERLREFLQLWTYEGQLQSFESREEFRKAALQLLGNEPHSPSG